MDASASPQTNTHLKEVYGYFLINSTFPSQIKQKSTIIKYTKLPDFDFDSTVSWAPHSYALQPRLRRIITLGEDDLKTTRSLKPELITTPKAMTSNYTKRKIITINEDEENDLHPHFSKDGRKICSNKSTNRSIETDFKEDKHLSHRTTSRLSTPSKYSKDIKTNIKINNVLHKKDTPNKASCRSKSSYIANMAMTNNKECGNKESIRDTKSAIASSKISVRKNIISESESEKKISVKKSKLIEDLRTKVAPYKPPPPRTRVSRSPPPKSQNKTKPTLKQMKNKNNLLPIIHVPLDNNSHKMVDNRDSGNDSLEVISRFDCGTNTIDVNHYKDAIVNTEPVPQTVDRDTGTDELELDTYKSVKNSNIQGAIIKEMYDTLDIPNVTLTKNNNVNNEDLINMKSSISWPNLDVSLLKKMGPYGEENINNVNKSTSYIVSRATVTYTTSQKIDFHMIKSNDEIINNPSPSPLSYPINVLSVFKTEMKNSESSDVSITERKCGGRNEPNTDYSSRFNKVHSLNCSYIFNSDKLMKPSDIISTIKDNTDLLQADDLNCEQFQKELNFIDSFFESLQYLESCSLPDKCFRESEIDNLVNHTELEVKNTEYSNFFAKLQNGTNIDDTETMASKSLCLLNLLIRDEQRRAKNLLFVLKMREDALKDFTKSQILWLENKKKQDHTDISTLKKKQRGALLKLQHECGEMQRMRKALLTLSEKRKLALMKTKKDIELKLKNNVDLEQVLLGKKKLRRSSSDRTIAPLKCFDLSSSGCEESTPPQPLCQDILIDPPLLPVNVNSAEKSIQAGDSDLGTIHIDRSTDTAAENFVAVDGNYLNIIFHNLSLPQIFSNGKQYEVNEEALKNIVNSANRHYEDLSRCDIEKLMEQIKNGDLDKSSTPSTARSLVDEFDQYYKSLADNDKLFECGPVVHEIKEVTVQTNELELSGDSNGVETIEDVTVEADCTCDCAEQLEIGITTGPLPVPAGACLSPEVQTDAPEWPVPVITSSSSASENSSVSSQPLCPSVPLISPVQCEAEELRRQQLAIEREIKALEEQQCLLLVREIPDKPPPPYTPPGDTRQTKPPRMYSVDDTVKQKVHKFVNNELSEKDEVDRTDAFDVFVEDFCKETVQQSKLECSQKPWDACNLLPQKQPMTSDKLAMRATTELVDVLAGVPPAVVTGVSSRRADHIDDILFAEWRRCEPEWTSLHKEEVIVKNQVFESIFQKILTETIDQYKMVVQSDAVE